VQTGISPIFSSRCSCADLANAGMNVAATINPATDNRLSFVEVMSPPRPPIRRGDPAEDRFGAGGRPPGDGVGILTTGGHFLFTMQNHVAERPKFTLTMMQSG